MIEEKNIDRLPKRNEALRMGFELILLKYRHIGNWDERIIFGNSEFVTKDTTESFLNGGSFNKISLFTKKTIPWFDIQKPKMRQMNLAEIDAYLRKKGRSLCQKHYDGDIYFNKAVFASDLIKDYKRLGTLNPDNTFEPLPLTEDK